MDGEENVSLVQHSEWSCPRCHHDLSRLPPTAKYCPRCGQNQKEIPLAEFVMPPVAPAPEHFHSVVIVGYARAMTQLGTRYELARNTDEALRCYCKAARLGNSEARSRLITRGIAASQTTTEASTALAEIPSVGPTSPDAPSDQPSPPVATAPQTL
jgi:hypothetical protein